MIANTNGPSATRAPIFTTRSSAEAYAIRSAQAQSRSGLACPVEFVPGAFAPEGLTAPVFAVEPACQALGEWTVTELTALGRIRRQQSGIRAEIDRLYIDAGVWTERALASRLGAVRAQWFTLARECREKARELELRLTVSGVRRAGGEFAHFVEACK